MEKKTISVEEFSAELTPYYIYKGGKRVEGRGWREDLVKKC